MVPLAQTYSAVFREDALLVTVAAPRRMAVVLFTILWTCGWSVTIAVSALDLLRHPDMDLERKVLWLAFWLVAGIAAGFVLFWLASGQKEIVRVDGRAVRIERRAGPLWRMQSIDAAAIRGIGYRTLPPRGWLDFVPIARFWRGALGRVVIETPRRSLTFGAALSDPEAAQIVELLRARLAHVAIDADRHVALSTPPMHYVASAGAALVAGMVLWPAVTLPLQLGVVDRGICFAGDPAPPVTPMDVSGAPPGGRVHLVALDGIRADWLDRVAQELRVRHRVPISVASRQADHAAYDAYRRQLNAARILDALERMHPSRDAVVVAVTDRDMYIPGFGWRYAFSYRAKGRLAVVSTARMERGCLGLLAANEDRQRARLRKMIGKNLGVLYFGLPLSNDPRSLMYAYVGGPQELDVMSEIF